VSNQELATVTADARLGRADSGSRRRIESEAPQSRPQPCGSATFPSDRLIAISHAPGGAERDLVDRVLERLNGVGRNSFAISTEEPDRDVGFEQKALYVQGSKSFGSSLKSAAIDPSRSPQISRRVPSSSTRTRIATRSVLDGSQRPRRSLPPASHDPAPLGDWTMPRRRPVSTAGLRSICADGCLGVLGLVDVDDDHVLGFVEERADAGEAAFRRGLPGGGRSPQADPASASRVTDQDTVVRS
jgi:hypothetical protein